MSIFEKAARQKVRIESTAGPLTVEQLWDLPLTANKGLSLDSLAMELKKKLNDSPAESFVHKTNGTNAALQLKFDLVFHILNTKLAEQEAAKKGAQTRAKNERIDELIQRKEEEKLASLSVEELLKLKNQD